MKRYMLFSILAIMCNVCTAQEFEDAGENAEIRKQHHVRKQYTYYYRGADSILTSILQFDSLGRQIQSVGFNSPDSTKYTQYTSYPANGGSASYSYSSADTNVYWTKRTVVEGGTPSRAFVDFASMQNGYYDLEFKKKRYSKFIYTASLEPGNSIEVLYNRHGKPTHILRAWDGGGTVTERYTYDRKGYIEKISRSGFSLYSTYTYLYNKHGQVLQRIEASRDRDQATRTYSTYYSYYPNNLVYEEVIPTPSLPVIMRNYYEYE